MHKQIHLPAQKGSLVLAKQSKQKDISLFAWLFIVFLFCIHINQPALAVDVPYYTYGFFQPTANQKIRLRIIGKNVEVKANKRRILIRLFEQNAARKGEKLFIINERNQIIGTLNVENIFSTLYFGQMVSGTGFFRLIPPDALIGQEVRVREQTEEDLARYIAKGENYLEEGLIGESIRYYKKALSLDPKHPHALLGLGDAYMRMQLFDAADQSLRSALSYSYNFTNQEDHGLLYLYLADIQIRQAEALSLDNNNNQAIRNKKLIQAYTYLQSARKLISWDSRVSYFMGRIAFAQNKDTKALDHFREAIQQENRYLFESYWFIGQIFKKKRMYDKAAQYYEKALEIRPSHYRIRRELEELRRG